MAEIDDQLLARLVAYVDGEASPSEAAEIERLIAGDSSIRAEVEGLRESGEKLKKLMKAEAANAQIPDAWLDLVRQHDQGTFVTHLMITWKARVGTRGLFLIAGLCALLLIFGTVFLI